jgi:membrane protease subunit (stomatin/prohibitin family)
MLANQETRDQRVKICNDCEYAKLGFCTKCGCVIQIKTSFKVQTCPEGKWSSE